MTENAVFGCPSCGIALPAGPTGPPSCPRCRLTLVGPLAAELAVVDRELAALGGRTAQLHQRRQVLLAQLRGPVAPSPTLAAGGREPAPVQQLPIQTTLLGLGALLLAIAGAVFAVVAYGRLGIGGRAAILVAVTGIAASATVVLHRRRLTATADAVGVLTLALTALDLHAARLLAAPEVDLTTWWSLVAALLAALGLGGGVRLRLGATTAVGVTAAQFVLPLGAVALLRDDSSSQTVGVAVTLALVATAVGDLTARKHSARHDWAGAGRRLALVAGIGGLVGGGSLATGLALDAGTAAAAVPGAVALLAVAGGCVWTARLAVTTQPQPNDSAGPLAAGAGTAALLGAALALLIRPWQDLSSDGSTVLLLPAVLGLLLALASLRLPSVVRQGPIGVGTGATLLAGTGAAGPVLAALVAPLALLGRPWPTVPPPSAAAVFPLLEHPVSVGIADVLLLVVVAAALLVAARVNPHEQWDQRLRTATVAVLAGALLLVPAAVGLPLVAATGAALLVVAVVVSAVGLHPTGDRLLLLAVPFAGTALAWSAADELLTLLTLALLAVLAAAAALVARGSGVAPSAATSAGAALALPPVAVLAGGGSALAAGVVLAAVAAVGLVALDGPAPELPRSAVLGVGLVAALLGLAMTATDPMWLALVLTGLGVAALAGAVRPGRQGLAALGAGLFAAASWVRLAELHVTTPEAYTLPSALIALVVGEVVRRRRPELDAGLLLGPGLSLALLPSLLASFADDGALRPLLLTVGAFAAVVAGSSLRLRAPLLIGGGVLAAVAVRQLGPLAVQAPRWVLLGGVGLVLLVLGARYERTRAEVDRLRRSFAELD